MPHLVILEHTVTSTFIKTKLFLTVSEGLLNVRLLQSQSHYGKLYGPLRETVVILLIERLNQRSLGINITVSKEVYSWPIEPIRKDNHTIPIS